MSDSVNTKLRHWDSGPNADSGWEVVADEGDVWAQTCKSSPDEIWINLGGMSHCIDKMRAEDLAASIIILLTKESEDLTASIITLLTNYKGE
jgi:hypothetical protein